MALFKYVGFYAVYYGSGMPTDSGTGTVNPGDVIDFAEQPAGLFWVPVDGSPVIPVTPPETVTTETPSDGPETNAAPVSEPAPSNEPPVIPVAPEPVSEPAPAPAFAPTMGPSYQVNPNTQPAIVH